MNTDSLSLMLDCEGDNTGRPSSIVEGAGEDMDGCWDWGSSWRLEKARPVLKPKCKLTLPSE